MARRLPAYLEKRIAEQERDDFNRKYPVGSRLRVKPEMIAGWGYPDEVVIEGQAYVCLGNIIIPVADIAQVLLSHLDLEGAC